MSTKQVTRKTLARKALKALEALRAFLPARQRRSGVGRDWLAEASERLVVNNRKQLRRSGFADVATAEDAGQDTIVTVLSENLARRVDKAKGSLRTLMHGVASNTNSRAAFGFLLKRPRPSQARRKESLVEPGSDIAASCEMIESLKVCFRWLKPPDREALGLRFGDLFGSGVPQRSPDDAERVRATRALAKLRQFLGRYWALRFHGLPVTSPGTG